MSCGQRPALMDREQLMHWILRRLGAPRWNIELHPCQLEDAIEDAIQWFVKWQGDRKQENTTMVAGQVVYPWPDEADFIIDVVPPGNPNDLYFGLSQVGFAGAGYYGNTLPYDYNRQSYSAGGPYSAIGQGIQYTDMARRVISREWNWWTERAARTIHVSPVPTTTGTMAIFYKSGCFDLQALSAFDHDLLKRYALSIARETLGLIRRKYTVVEGAGTSKQLDGADLVREALEEREKLEEEIRKAGYPMPLVTG